MFIRNDGPTKTTRPSPSTTPARTSRPTAPARPPPASQDRLERSSPARPPVALNAPQGTQAPVTAGVPAGGLKRGDYGPKVKQLQDSLVAGGYLTQDQVNTGPGLYGPRTQAAVQKLQKDSGLPETGNYDAATAAALSVKLNPPSDGTLPAVGQRRGATGPETKKLQDALVKTGDLTPEQVATGPGLYGPKTEGAVRALQLRNGLEATGTFDAATQAALGKELEQYADPGKLVDATYQRLMNRAPTAEERSAAIADAEAVKGEGGALRQMRNGLSGELRQTPEYRAAHPLGSGTVSTTEDADEYFLTQWGGTETNAADGAPYGYNDCGPTSGVMALSAIGLMERPEPEGASEAIDAVRDAAFGKDTTRSDRMGFGTLANGLHEYGAETQMLKGGVPAIDEAIERGNPVILGGNPWAAWGKEQRIAGNYLNSRDPGGHFVTVLGKTADGKYILGDPLVKNGTLAVSEAQLKTFLGQGFGAMEVSRP